MTWNLYTGNQEPHAVTIPPSPPWRRFPRPASGEAIKSFQPPEGLADVVNAALHLRRPLLLTGPPGIGKSTVVESVAYELKLGDVLRWNITSRSTLKDALYRYDALGRLHASQIRDATGQASEPVDIGTYLQLGPLGTALLGTGQPRALLIDELDKSDLDLTSDLLNVLERGEYTVPELERHKERFVTVRGDDDTRHTIEQGKIRCTEFPFIVLTSNGERDFPAPFLRRCLRFTMPDPDPATLAKIVHAHITDLDDAGLATSHELITAFIAKIEEGKLVATDQLLNAVYLLTRQAGPGEASREHVKAVLLQQLSSI